MGLRRCQLLPAHREQASNSRMATLAGHLDGQLVVVGLVRCAVKGKLVGAVGEVHIRLGHRHAPVRSERHRCKLNTKKVKNLPVSRGAVQLVAVIATVSKQDQHADLSTTPLDEQRTGNSEHPWAHRRTAQTERPCNGTTLET